MERKDKSVMQIFSSVISLASFLLVGESVSSVITSQIMKGMAQLRSARCYHVIHLRLAAKLEMQLTISAFCLSAPHMLWRKRGGGRTKQEAVTSRSPYPQVSLA